MHPVTIPTTVQNKNWRAQIDFRQKCLILKLGILIESYLESPHLLQDPACQKKVEGQGAPKRPSGNVACSKVCG